MDNQITAVWRLSFAKLKGKILKNAVSPKHRNAATPHGALNAQNPINAHVLRHVDTTTEYHPDDRLNPAN